MNSTGPMVGWLLRLLMVALSAAYRFLSHQPTCSAAAFAMERAATLRSVVALALLNFRCVETPTENDLSQPLRCLTLKEAAAMLQISQRTAQRMIERKELPAFKVGGQ